MIKDTIKLYAQELIAKQVPGNTPTDKFIRGHLNEFSSDLIHTLFQKYSFMPIDETRDYNEANRRCIEIDMDKQEQEEIMEEIYGQQET